MMRIFPDGLTGDFPSGDKPLVGIVEENYQAIHGQGKPVPTRVLLANLPVLPSQAYRVGVPPNYREPLRIIDF